MLNYKETANTVEVFSIFGQKVLNTCFHSRYTFFTKDYVVKFDRDFLVGNTKSRWIQSSIEIELHSTLDTDDLKFFVPTKYGYATPKSRGYVLQPVLKGIKGDCTELVPILDKYGISDVVVGRCDNCFVVNGFPIIFDWGVCSSKYKKSALRKFYEKY